MVSVTVMCIAILGTASFRYYATLDSRKAAIHTTGARIALMLTESWRAVSGSQAYDPVAHLGSHLNITQIVTDDELDYDESFTLLGTYTIVLNGTTYDAILSWKDVNTGLRALNVVVSWQQLRAEGSKSFKLTTYTLTD